MPRSEDIGKLISRGLKFAAGAAFAPSPDIATAGTPGSISKAPTIGQRIRGGVSAISPGFREFEELRRSKAISSAEFNQIQEETRITREQDKRDNEPLFFEDFTKGFGKRNKAEFERRMSTEGIMREQGGKKYVLRGELRGRVDKLDDEPDEKIEIATNEILDFKETIGDLELRKNKEIEKLLNERKKLTESGHTFNESARDYENRLRSNQPGSLLVQTANEEIADLNAKTKEALIEIETQRDILRKGKAEGVVAPKLTGLAKTFDGFGIDINDPNQVGAITDEEWQALAAQIDDTLSLTGEVLKQLVFRNFGGSVGVGAGAGSDPLGIRP